MALKLLGNGLALSGIEAIVITKGTNSFLIKTGSHAAINVVTSAGQEQELRKKDRIFAQNITQDIPKGYDLQLTDLLMNPEVMAIVDGGVAVTDGQGKFQSYTAPVMGEPIVRDPFKVDVYCSDLDTDGETKGYLKVTLDKCKGTPCSWDIQDGQFYSPQYTIRSRPAFGTTPISVEAVDVLPTVTP